MRELSPTRTMRRGAAVLGLLGGVVGAIGWLHTPGGLGLLARLGVPCPVDHVDPRLVESVREEAMLRSRGSTPAPERPALGLSLDRSTQAEVWAWASRTHAHCTDITRGFHYLRCRGVPAASLGIAGPPVSEVWFSFGPTHALIAINLYRRDMNPSQLLQSWTVAVDRLRRTLGEPTQSSGDLSLAHLASSPIAVARVQYVYSNYIATVTASHLPYGGLAVREQYMSEVGGPA